MDDHRELSDAHEVIFIADGHDAINPPLELLTSGLRMARVTFAAAARAIEEAPQAVAALLELREADISAEALIDIADAAYDARLRMIVVFDAARLDDVGGVLIGTDAILLCDPQPGELAGALALAASETGLTVRDGSQEAARLQRLNEEVARFAATLAKLTTSQDPPGRPGAGDTFVAERAQTFEVMPGEINPAEIRRTIRARRMRDDAFGSSGLFEDPAWDMLLDLFAAELERRRVSVSSLCIAAAVAPTTALRWIGKLIEGGLLDRRPDDFDRRRAYLSLTGRASTALRNYVAAIRRADLNIA